MRRAALTTCLLALFAGGACAVETWRDANYPFRVEIAIDNANVDGDLTNFPVLIVLADGDQVDKAKIADDRYVLFDGSGNLLKHEQEAYAEGVDYVNLSTWCKVPSVTAAAATSVWLYYGYDDGAQSDAANVWDASYEAVWHLAENGGQYLDSTANNHDDDRSGSDPTQTTGVVGKAQAFTSDYINFASLGLGTSDLTVTAWAKTSAATTYGRIFCDGDDWRYELFFNAPTNDTHWVVDDDTTKTEETHGNDIEDGAWHFLQARRDYGNTISVTVDGDAWDSKADGTGDITTLDDARIGYDYHAHYWAGDLDEIRVSTTVRADAWLKFARSNVAEADNELSVGAEESQPAAGGMGPQFLHFQRMRRSR